MEPPAYFEPIRAQAARRWAQLEGDPELAAPWHQLFRQVQDPRHVLSELLQNADDAHAKNASVRIENDEFVFEHDGEDFTQAHFSSLCKFGYSNKRSLHTIGFRGVGFKSTFSIGDEVHLVSPTLSVAFRKKRFTEPVWVSRSVLPGTTQVRVRIRDAARRSEIEASLDNWAASPLSLVFFKDIHSLSIRDSVIRRTPKGQGPVKGSEWISLSGGDDEPFLLIRSSAEPFPDATLEEIRQERMADEDFSLPPCQIDLVVGFKGTQRLFVVLPAGVDTKLPFTVNAPFIQDPSRVRIKAPGISETNKWLLERAGRLAAEAMLAWLHRMDLPLEERCRAYTLFPDVDRDDKSLSGVCGATCECAFDPCVRDTRFLLTDTRNLVEKGHCVTVPAAVYDIWQPEAITKLVDSKSRLLLCRHVVARHRQVLVNWEFVEEIDKPTFLNALKTHQFPKPETWWQLLLLWDFVSDELDKYDSFNGGYTNRTVQIVPVEGHNVLYSAANVVRLGEGKVLNSDEDWQFLSGRLLVLHHYWSRYLADERLKAEQANDKSLSKRVENAIRTLSTLGLRDAHDVSRILEAVATEFFAQKERPLEDCVRLAHIAAALGARVPDCFQYVSRDGVLTPIRKYDIVLDLDGNLDLFVDEQWQSQYVLHGAYGRNFSSCTEAEWIQWASSERSRLYSFVPLQTKSEELWNREALCRKLKERGAIKEPVFRYKRSCFLIEDWDFDGLHWQCWNRRAKDDPAFWGCLLTRILQLPQRELLKALVADALHVVSRDNRPSVTDEKLLPAWIIKFRELPCLQDTHGVYHKPSDLLRRTPKTEALLELEPFVRAELDTERTRPLLIKLGVQDTPTGPDKLIERLRELSKAEATPIYEVEKWYRRLDQMFPNCNTEEAQRVRDAFASGPLILTADEEWAKRDEVFLNANEEDVPGAATVHPSVKHLMVWQSIGVAERPTAEKALAWLKSIPSGSKLTPDEQRRVKSLLQRHAVRAWQECGHWLNLEGEWAATTGLRYRLTMQALVPWSNLFASIRQKTADLQPLSADTCQQFPFSTLVSLGSCIEERIEPGLFRRKSSEHRPWMKVLGLGLARIKIENEEEAKRIRQLGLRLADTVWQPVEGLASVPYIDGAPAGTSRSVPALWKDNSLYVEDQPMAKTFKAIAQALSSPFGLYEIGDAIKFCMDRPGQFVSDYVEENFDLLPPEEVEKEAQAEEERKKEETPAEEKEEQPTTKTPPEAEREPEAAEPDQPEPEAEPEKPTRKPPTPHPHFVERFARSKGFRKDGADETFIHPDGSRLRKSDGDVFHWEMYSAAGELVQSYWLKEHCLLKAPLQMDVPVWNSCTNEPDRHVLVLVDANGNPEEFSGQRLKMLVKSGRLKLFPAEYRLVYEGLQ